MGKKDDGRIKRSIAVFNRSEAGEYGAEDP